MASCVKFRVDHKATDAYAQECSGLNSGGKKKCRQPSNLTSARYRTHSTYIYRFSWCRCIGITVIAAALTIALLTLTKDSSANLLAKDLTNVPRFPLKGKGTDTIRPNDNDQSFVTMHSMHTIKKQVSMKV